MDNKITVTMCDGSVVYLGYFYIFFEKKKMPTNLPLQKFQGRQLQTEYFYAWPKYQSISLFWDEKSWDETSRYRTKRMIPSDSSYFCDKQPIKRCIITQIYTSGW